MNECNASVSVCDVNADCKNTVGSYRCTCKAGFTGDGKTCTGEIIDKEGIKQGLLEFKVNLDCVRNSIP